MQTKRTDWYVTYSAVEKILPTNLNCNYPLNKLMCKVNLKLQPKSARFLS